MPRSADELVSLIDEELPRWNPAGSALAVARHTDLLYLRDLLKRSGFPTDRDRRWELSMVPIVFQEAGYDGIEWTDRTAPLGHLSGLFAIDLAVQTGGRERHELSDDEYADYVRSSFVAIEFRTKG
jgi:hypothetical protein